MNENQREAIVAATETIAVAWKRIRKAFISIAETISNYRAEYIEAKQRVKLLRQSWTVKQDTRRLSQVINNKPAHMPRILY